MLIMLPRRSLVVARSLDRETQPSYDIEIVAKDFDRPRLESRLHLRLVVLDCNDKRLKIVPQRVATGESMRNFAYADAKVSYEFRISENNALIGCVQCTEGDENENARLRYHVHGAGNIRNLMIGRGQRQDAARVQLRGVRERQGIAVVRYQLRCHDQGARCE